MAPEARSKFGAPVFEFEVSRKQMCSIEESTCDYATAAQPAARGVVLSGM